tara:strand:+ start:4471 stop:4890 length:420 start_codon:yes stop_codon:yes gene_type:complete
VDYKYIMYNNVSGDIYFIKKFKEKNAIRMCNANTSMNMSYILESEIAGTVFNSTSQELDLSTTPFSVVKVDRALSETASALAKKKRNTMLTGSDWTQGPDSPLSDEKKAEWQTYRQALRDFDHNAITQDWGIVWPPEPS